MNSAAYSLINVRLSGEKQACNYLMLLLIVHSKFSNEKNNRKYAILHQKSQFTSKVAILHQNPKLDHYNVLNT